MGPTTPVTTYVDAISQAEEAMNNGLTDSKIEETDATIPEVEMTKYGITVVPVDYFHYKEFRYTNLKDAIAQAKRDDPTV
jgi:hypothetical protein